MKNYTLTILLFCCVLTATAQTSYTGTHSYSSLPMNGSYIELECDVTVYVKDASAVLQLGHKTNSVRITGIHYHTREIPLASIPADVLEKIKSNIDLSVSWDLYNGSTFVKRMGHNVSPLINWAVVQGLPSKDSFKPATTENGHKLYKAGAIKIKNVKIEDAGSWLMGVADKLSELSKPVKSEKAATDGQQNNAVGNSAGSKGAGTEVLVNNTKNGGQAGTKTNADNDDDPWGTGKSTAVKKTEGRQAGVPDNAPPMLMDKSGNYYVQNAYGKYEKTDKANYDAVKTRYNSLKNSTATAAYNEQKKQNEQAAVKAFHDGQNDFLDNMKKQKAKSERDGQLMASSYYTAQAKSQARAGLHDLSSLAGSYESLDELNAAFNQQYSAIGRQQEILTEAGRDKVAANMDFAFKDANTNTAVYKGLATGLANLASDAAAEREAKRAREALVAEQAEQERLIKERKWRAILAGRNALLEKFPDGGIPLSSHKVESNNLYFFAYVLNPESIADATPNVQISNVYVVQQYSDGGWPFKNAILNDLKKASGATGNIVMVGYYTDESQAKQMHQSFFGIAQKSEMAIQQFNYKGRLSSGTAGPGNEFWGDASSKPEVKKAKNTDDDFWTESKTAKPAPEKKAVKKDDDFWD